MKFPKIFFTKEYRKYDQSQLEFRIQMLKTIVILTSLTSILFMVIAFPSRKFPLAIYVVPPLFLIFMNVVYKCLQTKGLKKYSPYYLLILQLLTQIMTIELSLKANMDSDNSFKIYFSGFYAGIFQIIGFLNFSSSPHKLLTSLSLFIQIISKDAVLSSDNIQIRVGVLLSTIFFINYVFFKSEILMFGMWSSLMKRNESLLHFQKLTENFPNQILIINESSLKEHKPLYCNKEAECFFEGLVSSTTEFLESLKINADNGTQVKLEKHHSLLESVLEMLNNKQFKETEYCSYFCARDNNKWAVKIGWIEWSQNDALILIFTEISKSEKIKELQMLDKNKNKLLATVSHELRTPINGTLGMIENAEGLLEENQHEAKLCLDIAKNSTKTLLIMVNDILDMEQIRNGKLRLNIQSLDLHQLILRVLPLIEVQIKNRSKSLSFIYENECPIETKVLGDAGRLQQILWNLLWNACKFTSSGYVKLKVSLKPKIQWESSYNSYREKSETKKLMHSLPSFREEENLIEISIEDTGIGMDSQTVESLFQDFGKKDNPCNPTGVGLGLAISQSLVKQMNSTGITVESECGKGSKFSFSLDVESENHYNLIPCEVGATSLKHINVNMKDKIRGKTSSQTRFNILIVDDDLVNQCVFDHYFKILSSDCTKEKAFNGKDALKIILDLAEKGIFFDLVLMDCSMPVMDGFQATIAINELVAKGKIPKVTIIALTADSQPEEKEYCKKVGMKDVWTKPISKLEFQNNIRGVMENR